MQRRFVFPIAVFLFGVTAWAQAPGVRPDRPDVSYGPSQNNKFDLWLAKSEKPTPLIVFIHGGGFVGGDKRGANQKAIKEALDAGVSYASINYRFRTEIPIQEILRDCARAVQYLRYHAKELNIDKTKLAAYGGSAGAGTSLWLAFHDDLADAGNADPVLRESTRLVAAGAVATQATYDLFQWKVLLGMEDMYKFIEPVEVAAFYGAKSVEEMKSPKGVKILADVDMLALITKDDPPVFLASSSEHDALANRGDVNHTSKHAMAVKKRCDEVGVPAVLKIGKTAPGAGNPVTFLVEQLKR